MNQPDPAPFAPDPLTAQARKLALFEAVFEEIPDVIVLKDARGNFLLCNRTVAELYNTTPDAMVGKHDGDFGVPPEIADAFRANVLDIMARGETEVVFEDSRNAVTGEIRHFKSIKKPFKDAQGNPQILVIAHDITDVVRAQHQVAQSEQRLQAVMSATQEGVWDWHLPSGRVEHNPQWYRILGYADGELAGTVDTFASLIHAEDRAMVWARLQEMLSGAREHYHSEHRMLRKDGSPMWVQDRGRIAERNAQGEPLRVVGAYADISERKRHEAELERALNLAQAATQAKSDFLATMSHELRTPLNGILGMAQLLLKPDLPESTREDYASTILSSGKNLLALLNDILDLSKVEAGKLELVSEAYEPDRLLRDTAAVFAQIAQNKGLQLHLEAGGFADPLFWGDAPRLQQMLSNLMVNAIKFTAQGEVRLAVRKLPGPAGAPVLEFSVQDSGIGIAPEQQALLFKPFSQVDASTTRKYGGSGLGLSIVARLASLMGGNTGVHSQVGVGSRFWFAVPALRPPASARSAGPDPGAPPAAGAAETRQLQGRLLVAEDNPVNRMVISALLDNMGLAADMVEDGQLALEAVQRGGAYDVILMDVQMPVMDGQQASRCIRQWEAETGAPRTAIVALTAGAFAEDRQRCSEAGMDDFLTKPIDLAHLSLALGRWLRAAP